MSQQDLHREVFELVRQLEKSQFQYRNHNALIPSSPVISRPDLRSIRIDPALPSTSTSGSTGEPVTVQKTREQYLWMQAANIRELLWRRWDTSKNLAVVTAKIQKTGVAPWLINPYLFKQAVGKVFTHPLRGNLQDWLDETACEYLFSYPSVINTLDTSRFLDIKSTGERGGTMYSCEEVGVIAIECPDNPDVYHVMENIIVEIDKQDDIIVTDLTHPYLKRYKLGDRGEFGRCRCGRKLQTLKKDVLGRVRNMAVAPDGSRFWPLFGTTAFSAIAPNLKRCQAVQTSVQEIVLRVEGDITADEEIAIKQVMRERLGDAYQFQVDRVAGFPEGKFEEFVCLV